MCDPLSLAFGLVNTASGVTSAVGTQEARKAQKRSVRDSAKLQRSQVIQQQAQAAEAAAQKNFELSREALAARGLGQAQNLGDRSVRAIGRSIGFELGQDKATVAKNQKLANIQASARLRGIDLTAHSQRQAIGDTSGLTLGLDIVGAGVSGITSGLSIASTLGTLNSPTADSGGTNDKNTELKATDF